MVRNAVSKVMWVGRATAFMVGLAVILALVFGAASTAFAHKGSKGFFHLGHKNVSKAITTLVKRGPGSALNLAVESGQPPMTVNSSGKVSNLNADLLDGQDAGSFANASHAHSGADISAGTVAEARIDGAIARDSEVSNGFVQGRGMAEHRALALNPNSNLWFWQMDDPDLWLSYDCRSDLASNGFVGIKNTSGSETVNLFWDNGSDNPGYRQLAPNEFFSQGAAPGGERVTFQVQGSYVATIEVFSAHRTSDNKCHVQAQALVTR